MQPWTILYIPSAVSVFIVLLRVVTIRGTDARKSLRYYSLTLVLVLVWMVLSLVMQNLSKGYQMEADQLGRAGSVITSLAVLFFVVSTIYFTRSPNVGEGVLVSLPLLITLVAILLDSFEVRFMSYWWLEQISDPTLRFLLIAANTGVILYGLSRLLLLRSKIASEDVKKRLTFLVSSLAVALASALVLYLFTLAVELPPLDVLSTGLSLLISYPAFSPRASRAKRRFP